jgi:hypothetical protein
MGRLRSAQCRHRDIALRLVHEMSSDPLFHPTPPRGSNASMIGVAAARRLTMSLALS